MGLFTKFLNKNSKYVYPKKYFGFKVIEDFDIRPLYDLKDNLIYMHAELLYEEDDYLVFFKEYNKVMYKYTIVNDYESYITNKLSDELIVARNLGRKFNYGLNLQNIGNIPTVDIIIFAQNTLDTIKYCLKYPKQTNDLYQIGLVYDSEYHRLLKFQYNRTYGPLFSEFKIAIYKDINAHDKEDY